MKLTKKETLLMLVVCLLVPSEGARCPAQTLKRFDLAERKITMDLSRVRVVQALSVLALDHRVAIGFERSNLDNYELSIRVDRGNLKEVLDLIVLQAPVYSWEVRDGVINLVPTRGRDPLLQNLLSTQVSRFKPPKGANKFELRNTLVDLPRVQCLLRASDVTVPRLSDYAYYSTHPGNGVDLSISRTNVRGVLNKIARETEHNLWIVQWQDEKQRKLMLGF